MAHAAHLMLEADQHLARTRIDDILEAVLVLIALLGNQPALQKPPMRLGKIYQCNLDMRSVIRRNRPIRLTENQILVRREQHPHPWAFPVLKMLGRAVQDLPVKSDDAVIHPSGHVNLHVGHTQHNSPEPHIRGMQSDLIAPWAGDVYETVTFAKAEAAVSQVVTDRG